MRTLTSHTAALFLALSVLLYGPSARAQVLAALTPAQIAEAIALGAKVGEAKKFLREYRLRTRGFGSNGPTVGMFTTPFSRVVALSLAAHERYAPFSPEDIDAAVLEPTIEVHAWPAVVSERRSDSIASVMAIVIMPDNAKDRSLAIQPLRTEHAVTTFSNLFGARRDGEGLMAVFPIAEFKQGRDLHIVFDQKINTVGVAYCDDCKIDIQLTGRR